MDALIELFAAKIIEMYFHYEMNVISIAKELNLTTDFVATTIMVEHNQIMENRRNYERERHFKIELNSEDLKLA
jgi:hypothetical protein